MRPPDFLTLANTTRDPYPSRRSTNHSRSHSLTATCHQQVSFWWDGSLLSATHASGLALLLVDGVHHLWPERSQSRDLCTQKGGATHFPDDTTRQRRRELIGDTEKTEDGEEAEQGERQGEERQGQGAAGRERGRCGSHEVCRVPFHDHAPSCHDRVHHECSRGVHILLHQHEDKQAGQVPDRLRADAS